MHHLISSNVVQNQTHCFGRIHSVGNRNQLLFRQADKIRVPSDDRQGCDHLAWLVCRTSITDFFHLTNQVPSRGKGSRRRFGMNALPHKQVGIRYAGSQNSQAALTHTRLGQSFRDDLQYLGPTRATNDHSCVYHRYSSFNFQNGSFARCCFLHPFADRILLL